MNQRVKALSEQAAALTADERAELVECIMQTLDPIDPAIDALWAAECKDRLEAWRRGELASVPADEVFGKYRTP